MVLKQPKVMIIKPEATWAQRDQNASVKNSKIEHESVAKDHEELRWGVKGLSNVVIAGFPRNLF
jgi:hypothetical protein